MRNVSAAMQTALNQPVIFPAIFVELDFLSGTTRFWSGVGTFPWDGKDWYGSGSLGQIGEIEETQDIQAVGLSLILSGIPPEMQSIAQEPTEYRGRLCRIWFGLMNAAHELILSPIRILDGRMDVMSCDDFSDTVTLSLTVENRLIDLFRAREQRWTDQEQKTLYAGDKGLEYVASLQNKEIIWGR